MKTQRIIQFICYNPRIYSGFDNFQIQLSQKLLKDNYQPVLVYFDEIKVEKLKNDIINSGAILEFVNTKSFYTLFTSILRIFAKYKPFVVHSHFENKVHFLVAFFSLFFRIKYYFSIWSEISKYDKKEYIHRKGYIKYQLLKIYFRFLIFSSKKSFFGSNAIKNQLLNLFQFRSSKIETFYLGTKIYENKKPNDELRLRFNVPEKCVVLCNISAIEHIKGIHTLIEALSILKNEHKIDKFVCYHAGTIRNTSQKNIDFFNQLKQLLIQYNLTEKFRWLEFVDDITDILKVSDIYIHPSLQEGLGSANLEAATQSLPIIGTNVGGIPEIVIHNVNGFLFEPGDCKKLAFYIYELISDKEKAELFGKESYRLVSSKFNFVNQVEKMSDSYLVS
jgi:glycosyltransferase involved in cell wall biosynthesis